ncbi:sigma factor G inhibitor Gin [Gracilibacillus sp. S3-1-1]|uniref:Sigma factor G inhibitor Gin n=1 Tax=Gracilibacillus pellucidus TaxID=3095368 RepID=A0ACC6M994_9BACI|nr:sigma factor G inhibitor Gin [Gracilibacillus sp. S3-1-1]MDX8047510.1 sigma factor G inhibitor Gin [Gracilibacillus sp. S3-1-1]
MSKKYQSHYCGVCDEQKREGIFVYQMFICQECEQKIVSTKPNDENYEYYIDKMKAINKSSYTV